MSARRVEATAGSPRVSELLLLSATDPAWLALRTELQKRLPEPLYPEPSGPTSTHEAQPEALNRTLQPRLYTAPRGGPPDASCACCFRLRKNKILRTCASCGGCYCGRRVCRAWHALTCMAYRPHWQRNTRRARSTKERI